MLNNKETYKWSFFGAMSLREKVLLLVAFIFIVLIFGGSYFFTQTIEKFFWEGSAQTVIQNVESKSIYIQEADILHWQEADAQERLDKFEKEIKKDIPNISATKIFTLDGTLAFTDLKNITIGTRKVDFSYKISELKKIGHMVKSASDSTKQELGKTNLLAVWTIIKNQKGEEIGYVEFYFDSSDIQRFIQEINFSIWVLFIIVLIIIVILLRLAFRKQDDLIIRQARELSNIIEKSPIGIYIINKKGIITTVNKKMLGFLNEKDSRKIIGQDIFTLSPVQKLNIEELIHEALLGKPFEKETICVTDNGIELCQRYQATPLFTDDGKSVEQVLLTVEDITNQKKVEVGLASQAKGLESLVAERTKKLEAKIAELEQFQRVTVDREIRMTELKQQIEKMRIKLERLGETADTA